MGKSFCQKHERAYEAAEGCAYCEPAPVHVAAYSRLACAPPAPARVRMAAAEAKLLAMNVSCPSCGRSAESAAKDGRHAVLTNIAGGAGAWLCSAPERERGSYSGIDRGVLRETYPEWLSKQVPPAPAPYEPEDVVVNTATFDELASRVMAEAGGIDFGWRLAKEGFPQPGDRKCIVLRHLNAAATTNVFSNGCYGSVDTGVLRLLLLVAGRKP